MPFKFEIIDTNSLKWNKVIALAEIHDFHHTSYFHKIDNSFSSKLLVFSSDENFIALPIVIRPIEYTDFFDITSVYGYAGPIYRYTKNYNPDDLIKFFQTKFLNFCSDYKIVSVFSRLHPLIEQKSILSGLGTILELNKTVSINLKLTTEEQRKEYRKSLKSELNQLRRKEIVVREAHSNDEIDQFIQIYYQTMDRVDASPSYYFSKDYFYDFLNNSDFNSRLLIAIKEGEVISGAIFTLTQSIMQYHLAGTKEAFIKVAPMKLILDEARLIGNDTAAKSLHLGGGVGGQDTDSLFRFKSAFSKDFKQFSVWKFIVNEDIYNNLSKDKIRTDFFPLYRS
jgi:hypothetical protein